MGSRGSFLESGGFSTPAKWHTVDYVDGIKVLTPKDPKASMNLPEMSNTPGTSYLLYRKNGDFDQLRVFGDNRVPKFDIDYGVHDGKKSLHVHYFTNGIRGGKPDILHPGDALYEKYKSLFKGGKVMNGIKMDELHKLISHWHEAEFEYNGTTYVLQPEVNDDKTYLVIWDCTPDAAKCIAKHEVGNEGDIPETAIDAVLSEKCFDGKSFLEIGKDVTVTVIY